MTPYYRTSPPRYPYRSSPWASQVAVTQTLIFDIFIAKHAIVILSQVHQRYRSTSDIAKMVLRPYSKRSDHYSLVLLLILFAVYFRFCFPASFCRVHLEGVYPAGLYTLDMTKTYIQCSGSPVTLSVGSEFQLSPQETTADQLPSSQDGLAAAAFDMEEESTGKTAANRRTSAKQRALLGTQSKVGDLPEELRWPCWLVYLAFPCGAVALPAVTNAPAPHASPRPPIAPAAQHGGWHPTWLAVLPVCQPAAASPSPSPSPSPPPSISPSPSPSPAA